MTNMFYEPRSPKSIQSIDRAVQILNCFYNEKELGVSEIAAQLGLNKSTAFGLINALVINGLLEQCSDNKKYRIGIALFELGNLAVSSIDLQRETKSLCASLADKYAVTVHIATHHNGKVVYIDKIDHSNSFILSSNVGRRAPMHCTGVGKAMLAYLPKEYLEKYIFCEPLKKVTEYTITDRDVLMAELQKVRETGVATDQNEIELGLTCIAVPVFSYSGTPDLAVSISFPYGHIQQYNIEDIKRDLLSCMDQLPTNRRLSRRLQGK